MPKSTSKRLQRFFQSSYSLPLILLAVAILAYGLRLPWLGFYWDDWPWVWFSHVMGPGGMLKIDVEHRPISGVVLYLGSLLAGHNPLGWQLYALVQRLLGAVALAWTLRQLWPHRKKQTAWVALLFLVYPGFQQQFVAVNNSRHLFPLIPLFLSFGWMVKAVQGRGRRLPLTLAALLASLMTMFTTEYYYGLELVRPVVLWLALRDRGRTKSETERGQNEDNFRFLRVLRALRGSKKEKSERARKLSWLIAGIQAWLPYLIPLVMVFVWRYNVSKQVNYQVTIFKTLQRAPGQGVLALLRDGAEDLFAAGVKAWFQVFQFPGAELFSPRSQMLYWGLVFVCIVGLGLYLFLQREEAPSDAWGREALPLAAASLVLSPLPFWVTRLDPNLIFPADRLNLPTMLGASLLLVALVDWLFRRDAAKIILLSILLGLAIGLHNQNASVYRRDWKYQQAFFQQLITRIPALAPDTALLINELPYNRSTDNSLTAPLNWAYAPEFDGGDLPLFMYYVQLRFGRDPTDFDAGTDLAADYRFYPFRSSPEQSLVLYHHPPACLRVLSPEYQLHFPLLPSYMRTVLPFSDLDRILVDEQTSATLPPMMAPESRPETWCDYFQRADLARQRGDWDEVARLGDAAFELDDSPNHASERIPFIEGYAHVGRWDRAEALSREALEINKFMAPMLCDAWERIERGTEPTSERDRRLERIYQELACDQYD
jgi:hypothetical protein